MKHYTKSIFTKILNEETGELESKRFIEDASYSKTIKQGWKIMYARYDEVVLSMNSQLETKLMIAIRDSFTKNNVEAFISQKKLAKLYYTTPSTVNRLVKKLVDIDFLLKIDRGIYRLNPYSYLPYQANGLLLQKEWDELKSKIED